MRIIFVLQPVLLALLLMAGGCDDKPTPPPNVKDATKPTLMPDARPTTQQIIAAPRTSTQIGALPLRMDLPAVWKLLPNDRGGMVIGPAPAGEIIIAFSRIDEGPGMPALFSRGMIEAHATATTRRMTDPTDTLKTAVLQSVGDARILVTTAIRPSRTTREDGKEVIVPATLQIARTYYVPEKDNKYLGYRMTLDLPEAQYQTDKQLMDEILGSIRFDPALVAPLPDGPDAK